MTVSTLKPESLRKLCDAKTIPFDLTSDVDGEEEQIIGQSRALEAIEFGVGIQHSKYNLYLAGSTGLGKHAVAIRMLEQQAAEAPPPPDWCYANNFDQFYRPKVVSLPAGRGLKLRQDMAQLIEDLQIAIPTAFESEEYRIRTQEIEEEADEKKHAAFEELGARARKEGILLIRTPTGYTLAPVSDDEPMALDKFKELPEKEQQRIQALIDQLKQELTEIILRMPAWKKEGLEKIRQLNTSFAKSAVAQFIKALMDEYADLPDVLEHIELVKKDIINNIQDFLPGKPTPFVAEGKSAESSPELQRFEINVLVDNSRTTGAPVVYEDNPIYNNLIGRIEHVSEYGALVTNFTLIKAGALHHANGGYLVLDARKLLRSPFAWDALKRALYAGEIRIESLERVLSLVSTVSLEPETIPLNLKVVLVGDRYLYYLLKIYDPEFDQLFKVTADFSETLDRDVESTTQYARLIAAIAGKEKARPIDRDGVACIIEQSAREAGDGEKLALHLDRLKEQITESDFAAARAGAEHISEQHVQSAVDARIRRADQLREKAYEQILRNNVLIDTAGTVVGQVNGLSVVQLGDFSFGQPSRITATARLGSGKVVDIERESKLGGPIHSKGVLILSSCLAHRYARDYPLALAATLVFEQSYGGVEGDSASIAEFCALVSALTEIPLKQSIAVTGSINQHGEVQAIGGVNQKIEGFFDICKARGLDAQQGVIIPSANIKNLMLRRDVVDAAGEGLFHIYAVDNVDDALELLTGMDAGEADRDGAYPEGSINFCIVKRIRDLNQLRARFRKSGGKREEPGDDGE